MKAAFLKSFRKFHIKNDTKLYLLKEIRNRAYCNDMQIKKKDEIDTFLRRQLSRHERYIQDIEEFVEDSIDEIDEIEASNFVRSYSLAVKKMDNL